MMKKTLFTLLTFFLILGYAFAQDDYEKLEEAPDSIIMVKAFMGYRYFYKDERVNFNQLGDFMKDDQQAIPHYIYARRANKWAVIFGSGGAFLIIWPSTTFLGGGELKSLDWALIGIGTLGVFASIPLGVKYAREAKKSVNIYNTNFSERLSGKIKTEFRLGMSANGIGLRMNF